MYYLCSVIFKSIDIMKNFNFSSISVITTLIILSSCSLAIEEQEIHKESTSISSIELSSSFISSSSSHVDNNQYNSDFSTILTGTSYNLEINKETNQFTRSREIDYEGNYNLCDSLGNLIKNTEEITRNYKVKEEQLIIWSEGSCYATSYKGNSTELLGTWTLSIGTPMIKVPDENHKVDDYCQDIEAPKSEFSSKLIITENQIIIEENHPYCYAERTVDEFLMFNDPHSEINSMKAIDCNQIEYTQKDGKVFSETFISSDFLTSETNSKLNYDGKVCNLTLHPKTQLTQEMCSLAYKRWEENQKEKDEDTSPTRFIYQYYDYENYPERNLLIEEYKECLINIGLNDETESAL
ncbi:hypothetical protein OAU52_00030 [bacterium]|nr:hypothetical protein [bacterium]